MAERAMCTPTWTRTRHPGHVKAVLFPMSYQGGSTHTGNRTPISGAVSLRLVRWTTWVCVPPAGVEPAPYGPSDRRLYRWATRAGAPRQGFEPQLPRPERGVTAC